jgi:hypothetical protein
MLRQEIEELFAGCTHLKDKDKENYKKVVEMATSLSFLHLKV